MANFYLTAQDVNGDPYASGGNINIVNNSFTDLVFVDVNDLLGITTEGEYVSIDGGTTLLSYEFMGFGDVRGDPDQKAAFIRIDMGDGTYQTVAIDMNWDQDGLADLQNGNTGLRAGDLDQESEYPFYPVCFVRGTRIRVPGGEKRVEQLRAGDLVETLDAGVQPLLWSGYRTHLAQGDAAPVRFAMGVIGNDRTLKVSQQHRILLRGWESELYFGQPETLIAARHMVNGQGIRIVEGGTVDYFHLLFAEHHLVWGNGVPSESYFPGHALNEDLSRFRGTSGDVTRLPLDRWAEAQAVRPALRAYEARILAA